MNQAVALLASRCPSVIDQVKGIAQEIPHVQIEVCSVQTACARALQPNVGLILTHLGGSEEPGITRLLWSLAQSRRACPTVVLCNRAEEPQASALLRAGAADYVTLPGELSRLRFLLTVLTRRFRPTDQGIDLRGQPASLTLDNGDDGFDSLMTQVRRVAPQDATLLLTGETGTGKTRLARLIHELSPRRADPFLVVDCGALSAGLVESELFGHARGAFTGAERERAGKLAAAGGGTLLLDEVNSLPLPLQGKLLRAVDDRVFEPVGSEKSQSVRARLIAASNVPLEREVESGRFRADLYYRLNVVGFYLPPLCGRRGSIVPLAATFLRESAARNGRADLVGFSPAAERLLEAYDWPGNIRELRNVVERAVALCAGTAIDERDLPEPIRKATPPASIRIAAIEDVPPFAPSLHQSKDEMEIRRIREALRRHNDKRSSAARELGISRVGLYKKLRKYGLLATRFANSEEADPPVSVGIENSVVPKKRETPIYETGSIEQARRTGFGGAGFGQPEVGASAQM